MVTPTIAKNFGNVVPLHELKPKRQTPLRLPNATLRKREHLTEHEADKLIEAAKSNRHGHRDSTMILIALTSAINQARKAGVDKGTVRVGEVSCTFGEPDLTASASEWPLTDFRVKQ